MKNIRNKFIAGVFGLAMGVGTISAQDNGTVSGIVLDENNEPVVGALVSIPGTLESTVTDASGRFFLHKTDDAEYVKCGFIGYKDATSRISGGDLKITMESDIAYRDEMIEVGMGRKERKLSYTGAISTVKANDIEKSVSVGLEPAITGKLAGLTSMQTSSMPGSDGTEQYIRGVNSLNGNAILVVLDGVPAPTLDVNTIDPMTVESVSILKDAAAKALYGPQAAQGAILITTKRGKMGKQQVNVNLNYAFDKPTYEPYQIDSFTYATLRNQALANDGSPLEFSRSQLDAFANGSGVDNNWRNMFLNKMMSTQRYSIDVSGGNNRVSYYVNAGYVHQDGIYKVEETDRFNPSQYYNRFTVVSNVDVNLYRNLRAFLNANARIYRTNGSYSGTSSIYEAINVTPPTVEGPLTDDGRVIATEYFSNPIYGQINRSGSSIQTGSDLNFNFGLDFDMDFITKGLKATGIMGYHSYYTGTINNVGKYTRYVKDENGDYVQFGSEVDSPISGSKSANSVYFLNAQATIEYSRQFGKHSVDAFVNYFAENRISSSFDATMMLPYDRLQLGGHVKYGYDDRYFIQGDFTHAATEQFAKGNRFHFSPTVSGAWVASNEEFLNDVSWLDLLKVRASYGSLKYDNLYSFGRFLYETNIRQLNGSGIVNALFTAALVKEYLQGNPNLAWEESRQQNYGIDFSFLKAFNVSVDYWRTNQKKVIGQDETTPLSNGIPSSYLPYENLGEVLNQGVDLEVSYTKNLPCGLNITARGNFGFNKNEVINMKELDRTADGYAYPFRKTGYAVGQEFGYLVDYSNGNGFFNSESELVSSGLTYSGTQPRVGDLKYQDLNGDKLIDERDKAPLDGVKTVPSFSYGASVEMDYKGFDLYLLLQGIAGYSRYYSGVGVFENSNQGVFAEHHLNAWTAERYAAGQKITYPALTASNSSNLVANDFFTSSSNYLRVKNLTFGYSLPKSLVNKWKMEKLRVFLSAENLLTFTDLKYKGFDPEQTDIVTYPIYRAFNIGVNVNF